MRLLSNKMLKNSRMDIERQSINHKTSEKLKYFVVGLDADKSAELCVLLKNVTINLASITQIRTDLF